MKNVSVAEYTSALESLQKKMDKAQYAELMYALKLGTDRLNALYADAKSLGIEKNITHAESEKIELNMNIRAGTLRYDSQKLDAYFTKAKIDSAKFKTATSQAHVVTYKVK